MLVLGQCREQLSVAFYDSTPVGDALAFLLLQYGNQLRQPKGQPVNNPLPVGEALALQLDIATSPIQTTILDISESKNNHNFY